MSSVISKPAVKRTPTASPVLHPEATVNAPPHDPGNDALARLENGAWKWIPDEERVPDEGMLVRVRCSGMRRVFYYAEIDENGEWGIYAPQSHYVGEVAVVEWLEFEEAQ